MLNLYWPVYKNLEKEVLELSNQVHFDDTQLSIYSVKISDLLIRCSVEIESISKDLFESHGGVVPEDRDLYFDTDCLQYLEDKWLLSKKKIILSSSTFHYQNEKNRVLTPLYKSYKRGSSGSDWKKAYQAVKHERVKSLKKGNIGNLVRGLGALFILNLYYKDEVWDLEKDNKATNFPLSNGSDLFSIKLHKWSSTSGSGVYNRKADFDECVFLSKWKTESEEAIKEANEKMRLEEFNILLKHPQFISWLQENKLEEYQGNNLAWEVLGQEDYIKMIKQSGSVVREPYSKLEYEIILNKNCI